MSNHKGYLGVPIDIKGPLLVVTESMNNARAELTRLLIEEPRNYEDQNRVLAEYQSHMRGADILAGHVDVQGNRLGSASTLLIDDHTAESAVRVMKSPPREVGGTAAVAASLGIDTEEQPVHVEEEAEQPEDRRRVVR